MFKLSTVLLISLTMQVAHALEFQNEVPKDVQAQMLADLDLVSGITAKQRSPLHEREFGNVSGLVYLKWFSDRITDVGYRELSPGAPAAIASNSSIRGSQNWMTLTNYFVKGQLPQIARITVLFHEARHSEKQHGFWDHRTCPKPFIGEDGNEIKSIFSGQPIAGLPGCDATVDGAYGVTSMMVSNISRFCTNCTEKLKLDAALYARDQANRLVKKSERQKLLKDAKNVAP